MSKETKHNSAELVAQPSTGRTFTAERRVSIDDTTPGGRIEFDAIARFLQDVGNDDTDDAGMAELGMAWVARRATIVVHTPATARELLSMTTWCSGTGKRWAERRTNLHGEHGAHIEASAIWVHLDATSGRPVPWGDDFEAIYMEATQGREVDAKLRHDKVVPEGAGEVWRFRKTDMDGFGHVNNAAYLAVAEEFLDLGGPQRVEVEWRGPSVAGEQLVMHKAVSATSTQIWLTSEQSNDLRVTIVATSLSRSETAAD